MVEEARARTALVHVMLATHNSERWLDMQLDSLAAQRGVQLYVWASDDQSSDATVALLDRAAGRMPLQRLAASLQRFGNANRNFLRLVSDTPLGDATHFALADHDDIWLPDKLERAVDELRRQNALVYSSDVTAFWPDGKRRVLRKAAPQTRWDHLFESAGPGCTFVFTRSAFVELRAWVVRERERLADVKVHDWLFYAYARKAGWRWVIDSESHMLYRQHERNERGANVGLRAMRSRWAEVRDGKYRRAVLSIARAVGEQGELMRRFDRLTWQDRMWLALHASQCRRHRPLRWLLAVMFLVMRRI